MALYRYFASVDSLPSPRGPLSCTHSPATISDVMRGRGQRVGVVSIADTVAKIRTVKISSGGPGGISAKVCTSENFPLYGICRHKISSYFT